MLTSFRLKWAYGLALVALSAASGCSSSDGGLEADGDSAQEADAASGATAGSNGNTNGSAGENGNTNADAATPGPDSKDGATDPGTSGGTGFPLIGDPTKPGPFPTNNPLGEAAGPNCSIHRPKTLGENGLRHPVIIWGMGTGGFNTYQAAFDLWASHGFIVAAGLQANGQGSGAEMLGCLDFVCSEYAPNIDCTRVGASGHSQGGGGAIMTGQDKRVISTAPVQPYTQQGFGGFDQASISKQTGAMLLLSGTADTIAVPAQNQQPVFETTNVPVFWGNLVDGNHVTEGINGIAGYRVIVLEWFGLQLMGDQAQRSKFFGSSCAYCGDSKWVVQRKDIK